jgi:hypothetical protein
MKPIMKKIFNCIGAFLTAACLLTACQPDVIPTIDPTAVPEVSQYESNIHITVDPETNQVTFSLDDAKGVYPIWIFDGTTYSTVNGLQKIFVTSGDYDVQVKVGNANGISDGVINKTFHVANSIVDFTKYYTLLCKDGKKWHIDGETAGHLGCGEPGTNGLNWWSAGPGEKKDWGVYDNILSFTHSEEGDTYTFDPGASGTIYVNKDVTAWPDLRNPDADFNVPVEAQTVNYTFEVKGNDLFLVFPEKTLFPYIANDDIYNTPRYRVESITAKQLELVIDNGNIAWHYLLSSGEMKKEFSGFNYKHEANLWKPIDDASAFNISLMYYAHGPSWEAYPDGSMTYTQEGSVWTISLPYESNDRWQAQFHIQPTNGLPLSANTNYDFSCIINSTQDIPGMTIKLTDNTNDGNFLIEQRVDVKAYEETIFWLSDLTGIDAADTKLVFDFGGNAPETVVTISNITLKDHAIDDGTVLPEDDPDDPTPEEAFYDITGATNLWRNSGEIGLAFWYANAGWSQIADPEFTWNGPDFTVTMPAEIGGSEWQGQTHFTIPTALYADRLYDFCATLNSSADCVCTIKLAWEGNDNDHAIFYRNDVALTAFEDVTFKMPKIAPDVDYDAVALFFDFGRTPAGAVVSVKDICLQEHIDPSGGDDDKVREGPNLWPGAEVTFDYWYSAGDWSGALAPTFNWTDEATHSCKIVIPEGIGGSEWQGQSKFHTNIPASADKAYNFSFDATADADMTITVKLAWEGNDNDHAFFYVNDFRLSAYETVTFEQSGISPDVDYDKVVLIVDLGRSPAGSIVELANFKFCEVAGEGTQLWDGSKVSFTYWYSAGDWSGALAPEYTWGAGNSSMTLVIPDGIGGSEWQGQSHFTLDAPVSAARSYDFGLTLNSTTDCVCTVKLAWEGNDNDHAFFYKNDVALSAYEDVRFEQLDVSPDVDYDKVALIVDLGRTPGGSTVVISDFSLIEY